jgi:hypothetical protein
MWTYINAGVKKIMGEKYCSIKEITNLFKITPTSIQCGKLYNIPFPEKVLRSNITSILIPIFQMSIAEMLKLHANLLDPSININDLMKKGFVHDVGYTTWHLVDSAEIDGLLKQEGFSNDTELPPTARVILFTMIAYQLKTGKKLFKDTLLRCSCSNGQPIYIGYGVDGIIITSDDAIESMNYGVACEAQILETA